MFHFNEFILLRANGQQEAGGRLEPTLRVLDAVERDDPADVAAAAGEKVDEPLDGACGITAPQLAALLGKRHALQRLQLVGARLAERHAARMLGGCCLHAAALGGHESTTAYLLDETELYRGRDAIDAPLLNGMTAAFLGKPRAYHRPLAAPTSSREA